MRTPRAYQRGGLPRAVPLRSSGISNYQLPISNYGVNFLKKIDIQKLEIRNWKLVIPVLRTGEVLSWGRLRA